MDKIIDCFPYLLDMPIENNSPPFSPVRKVHSNSSDKSMEPLDIDWKKKAEEELNENPEKIKRELAALKRLIKNDPNITVPDADDFLLRFLRARKFDCSKSFHMIQRYYLMKLKCSELFRCPLPSECESVFDLQAQNMLQDRDKFGRRVYVLRVDYFDSTRATIDEIFRTNVLALEQAVRESETQVAGIVVILDMAGLSLNHAKFFTPYYAKKTVELVQDTFPLRFKGFHIINEPFYFDAIMTVLKPFLKEKMRKRIYLHGNDLTSLHAFVTPDILPAEYGGLSGNFDNRPWYLDLLANEHYFKGLGEYGYNVVECTDED